MKKIQVKGNPGVQVIDPWGVLLIIVGLALMGLYAKEVNYSLVAVCLTWFVIIICNRYTSNSETKYLLEFGEENLVCKLADTIYWHIPLVNISHVEITELGKGTRFNPNRKQVLIHTRDGDSYLIPVLMTSKSASEIQAAVERVIAK